MLGSFRASAAGNAAYDEGDALCSSSRGGSLIYLYTHTLAGRSECMWHFNVHVTLHSATRIIVRSSKKKKKFALQQHLLPRDY